MAKHVMCLIFMKVENGRSQAYRNLIAAGNPLAMTDCLNYGSPEKKEIYRKLIDSTKGMSEA